MWSALRIAATRFDFAQHALSGLLGIAEGGREFRHRHGRKTAVTRRGAA
jgi:hypothetical protein